MHSKRLNKGAVSRVQQEGWSFPTTTPDSGTSRGDAYCPLIAARVFNRLQRMSSGAFHEHSLQVSLAAVKVRARQRRPYTSPTLSAYSTAVALLPHETDSLQQRQNASRQLKGTGASGARDGGRLVRALRLPVDSIAAPAGIPVKGVQSVGPSWRGIHTNVSSHGNWHSARAATAPPLLSAALLPEKANDEAIALRQLLRQRDDLLQDMWLLLHGGLRPLQWEAPLLDLLTAYRVVTARIAESLLLQPRLRRIADSYARAHGSGGLSYLACASSGLDFMAECGGEVAFWVKEVGILRLTGNPLLLPGHFSDSDNSKNDGNLVLEEGSLSTAASTAVELASQPESSLPLQSHAQVEPQADAAGAGSAEQACSSSSSNIVQPLSAQAADTGADTATGASKLARIGITSAANLSRFLDLQSFILSNTASSAVARGSVEAPDSVATYTTCTTDYQPDSTLGPSDSEPSRQQHGASPAWLAPELGLELASEDGEQGDMGSAWTMTVGAAQRQRLLREGVGGKRQLLALEAPELDARANHAEAEAAALKHRIDALRWKLTHLRHMAREALLRRQGKRALIAEARSLEVSTEISAAETQVHALNAAAFRLRQESARKEKLRHDSMRGAGGSAPQRRADPLLVSLHDYVSCR
eukprot:TRINITY_DN25477_c0_g1_i1.p1 TRINITY_DN25477_c0_g1~~TRINITY_DN25477_c0_g1_i1.p1  ORF type:complete len:644 (-),score=89.10 TRINITY_DN25477_c0_g1_i1:66-1997(-)